MAVNNNAGSNILASILPKEIKTALNGRMNFNITVPTQKWVYATVTVGTSSANALSVNHKYFGSETAVSMADKILWIAIKHTGTSDGSTKTSEGVMVSFDGGTVVYNLADATFIGSKELFIGKFPNTTLESLHMKSARVTLGLPTAEGAGNVEVQIAALLSDVA